MSNAEIPSVAYIDAITPDNAGKNEAVLLYEDLPETITAYARDTNRRYDAYWDAEPGSVEELVKARQLGFQFYVATAGKVVSSTPDTRDIWADRYTNDCMELFGTVDPAIAGRLIGQQLAPLRDLQTKDGVDKTAARSVLETYESVNFDHNDPSNEAIIQQELEDRKLTHEAINAVLHERFGGVLDLVAESGKENFTQPELAEPFTSALKKLTEIDDKAWGNWKVDTPKKGTNLSINGKKELVVIPEGRADASAEDALKLLKHELLVHGLRAKNGKKSDDPRLLKGYPNFLDADEGLGIIAGTADDGSLEDTIFDRYIDIAFATGVIGDKPTKREALHKFVTARKLVRAQASGEAVDPVEVEASTSAYVDRIYRGSPGDDTGERQAVYTADIYYYNGYTKMNKYIADQLRAGHSKEAIFDYLMQGKFDPTDPLHVASVGKL